MMTGEYIESDVFCHHVFGDRGKEIVCKMQQIKWLNDQRMYFDSIQQLNPTWKTQMSLHFSGRMNKEVEKLIQILNDI